MNNILKIKNEMEKRKKLDQPIFRSRVTGADVKKSEKGLDDFKNIKGISRYNEACHI